MAACETCGSPSEPILSACAFCGTPSPQLDPSSISDQELLMNVERWLGHIRHGVAFQGSSLFPKVIQRQECIGIARQYLTLLEVRVTANKTIAPVVERLTRDFEEATTSESEIDKLGRKSTRFLIVAYSVLFILGIGGLLIYLQFRP